LVRWRGALTAQLLLQGSVRDAYLGHAANEGEERPGHFGTAAVGLGGADRAALTVGLADALALAQGQMLATMLQPA
jgi:Mrp family chromosome partitioning ATPase